MDSQTASQQNERIYSATDYHEKAHAVTPRAFALILRYRGEKFARFIDPNDSVLEFGVGPGWNIMNLPARRRVGFDVTEAYAAQLRAAGVEFFSDLSALAPHSFDVVIFSHVMEHLLSPPETLAKIADLIKPSGRLVLIVPLEQRLRKHSSKDHNHHLYSWNVQTLTNLLQACGYHVESCTAKATGYDRFGAELAARFRAGARLYKFLLTVLRLLRPVEEIQAVAVHQPSADNQQ